MSSNHFNALSDRTKPFLRSFFLNKRKILLKNDADKKRGLDLEIQSRLLMTEDYRRSKTLLIYVSRDFEIDTRGILLAALSNKKRVAVPRIEEDGEIRFYYISSLSDLGEGSFGIKEPLPSMKECADFTHSICVCPALCCDMRGHRVGFGKGYYDRFLQTYPGRTLSLCYSDAFIPEIQTSERDVPVQAVVTDSFVRYID